MDYFEILSRSIEDFKKICNDNVNIELFTIENLNHWKDKYLTMIKYSEQVNLTNRSKLEPYIQLAELSLINHINNSNYLDQRFKNKKPWSWDKRFEKVPTDLAVILMYKTLTENFTSALILLINGYEYQAKIILRGYIELSALLFTFLLDADFAYNYLIVPNDQKEHQTHWFKFLKPEKVQSKLRALKQSAQKEQKKEEQFKLNSFDELQNSLIIDFQITQSNFRDKLYNIYSDYTHFSSQLLFHHYYDKKISGFKIGIGSNTSDLYNKALVNLIEYSCHANTSILYAINFHSMTFADKVVKEMSFFIEMVTALTCSDASFKGLYQFGDNN